METNARTTKEYLYSLNDELGRITGNHQSAKSEIIRVAYAFSQPQNNSWIVAKAFIDIKSLLSSNLESLGKMQSILSRARISLSFQSFIRPLFRLRIYTPSLEAFSRLLEKVITNLEKALDELRTLFLPLLFEGKELAQPLVMVLKDPLGRIEDSIKATHIMQELLLKIRETSQDLQTSPLSELDREVYEALLNIVPAAALTYKQAVSDLADRNRVSYRGVANEFREALRETLDYLASDNDVVSQPNFKFETNKTSPTMKQKARYILRSRGAVDNATKTPEEALEIIERVASFARATYERSSISTHIALCVTMCETMIIDQLV